MTSLEYHGDQVLITHYEVKAGQNLPASPDDPLYFRQYFLTCDLTFIFTIALPALIQALDDITGQSLHFRPILIFSSTFDSFYCIDDPGVVNQSYIMSKILQKS